MRLITCNEVQLIGGKGRRKEKKEGSRVRKGGKDEAKSGRNEQRKKGTMIKGGRRETKMDGMKEEGREDKNKEGE